jgi:hypothetical protein
MRWRHAKFEHERPRIRRVLAAVPITASRLTRFDECGQHSWLYTTGGEFPQYAILGSSCRDRFCPTCQSARAKVVSDNIASMLHPAKHRFATLTLRTEHEPLVETIDRLYAAFRQLRGYEGWRRHVTGGMAICEVKRNHTLQRWHVHLHLILEGDYFRKEALSALWRAATVDSYIVDIRQIRDEREVAYYLTKYLTKPISADVLDKPSVAKEVVEGLHRRHMCMTFGKWRGLHLTQPRRVQQWSPVCSFGFLMRAADTGQSWARCIVHHLLSKGPDVWTLDNGPHQSLDSTLDFGTPYAHTPPRSPPRTSLGVAPAFDFTPET